MDVNASDEFPINIKKIAVGFINARQDDFVNNVYLSVDEATGQELSRLYTEEGVVSSCRAGCYYCCGQHILTSIIEAQAIVHYIKRKFSREHIEDLRIRTRRWHEWDAIRSGRDKMETFGTYQYCPMLVDNECSIYPVRPLICRTHYVCSEPPACRPFYDPESIEDSPVALASVKVLANPFALMIRDHIRATGLDFYDSIMLLPHWLAIEMNWSFAVALR